MKLLAFFTFLIVSSFAIQAQDSIPLFFSNTISKSKLKENLFNLASEKMEGRETGTTGQKRAANYIYNEFKNAGLLNPFGNRDSLGYFQVIPLFKETLPKAKIKIGDKVFKNCKDFILSGFNTYSNEDLELVFLGTAKDSSFAGKNFSNKAVLFFTSNLYAATVKAKEIASKFGAKVILFCNPQNPDQYKQVISREEKLFRGRYKLNPKKYPQKFPFDSLLKPEVYKQYKLRMQTYQGAISPKLAAELLQVKRKDLKIYSSKKNRIKTIVPSRFSLDFNMQYDRKFSENVIAYLPGNEKKQEFIVISAHYDHIGKTKSKIFFGANDNASGTAAMLEIARSFQKAVKTHPTKRSILFVAFTGEEKGLLGSKYFVSAGNIPHTSIKFNLNLDMIGRKDKRHKSSNYIYLLGANHLHPKLKSISDSINQIAPQLELDYSYDSPDSFLYSASDQASFVEQKIPAIFYFNGLHKDYHRESDTPDKIDMEAVQKVARLVFLTAWELANQ